MRVRPPGVGDNPGTPRAAPPVSFAPMSKSWVVVLGALAAVALAAVGWLHRDAPPAPPAVPSATPAVAAADAARDASPSPPPRRTRTVRFQARDTLAGVLVRNGMPAGEAHQLAGALRSAGVAMRDIRTGASLDLDVDPQGGIVRAAYAPSPWQRFDARRTDDGWSVARTDVAPEVRVELREARIERSLWDAVDRGTFAAKTMLDLVAIFESDFDFTTDPRPGDRLQVLLEVRYAAGEPADTDRILAARYLGADGTMTGIGFEVDGRLQYYDEAGASLKKSFLRSPLQFTRISSGYTHRRMHPVLKYARPHLAIDYAAPTGTPVWAVADGTVEFAGRKGGNGIQVLLRHRSGYRTYYNHLSRVATGVRRGVAVRQKQVIGYVGSTGLSTGPHLDYRVSVDGRFVNPLSEKFLPGEPVPAARRAAFTAHATSLLAQLDTAAAWAAAAQAGAAEAAASAAALRRADAAIDGRI